MRAPRRLLQQVGPADGLEEEQDRIRVRVVHQQAGDLARRQVGLVAGGDQVREAEAPRRAARHDGAEHGAGLRHQREPPGRQAFRLQRRVHAAGAARIEVHEAHGIRPQDAHARRACGGEQAFLPRAPLRPRFGEAIGEDGRDRDPLGGDIGDDAFHMLGPEQQVGEVHLARDLGDAGVGFLAEDRLGARVHGKQLAVEAVLAQVDLRACRQPGRVGRGADEGDAAGVEQGRGERGHGVVRFNGRLARRSLRAAPRAVGHGGRGRQASGHPPAGARGRDRAA